MRAERAVERKIVSVLFADLVGFTSLSERLDAEDVAIVQGAYFGTVRETVERYDGRLEKFIGDAAMAVFGVPRTRDDDAERAVRAGLALASAVEQLGPRLGLEVGSLALRVGVNSGEVVHTPDAGPEEAMVTGDAVNVAARLQAAAAPGEVLVGETTALAVAGAVELSEPRSLELEGKAQPVPARPVTAVRREPSRDAAMGALRAPLLGRGDEFAMLLEECRLAREGPRRLLVIAPPGVGKSRLVEELAAHTEGVAVARARLRPDVLAPFEPIAQLFLAAGALDAGTLERRLAAGGVPPERVAVLVEEAQAVLRPAGDGVGGEREARFAAWLEALDALASEHVGLWIVEDVHWAGGDLLAFLEFGARAPGARLVVATSRPSLLETQAAWCAGGPSLELQTLAPTAASELVHALVGDALPESLVERIAERSDGNPLFIEELLRTWLSVGTLAKEDEGWRLLRSNDDVVLPETVQAIYAAQLDDLPHSARDVARRASVAGRRFAAASLEPLGAVDAAAGVDLLAGRAYLAGPVPDPLFGTSYVFRHALLRDASYASLARADRARLHVAVAGWLEGLAGSGAGQLAEPIGRHYARAVESAPALAAEVAPGLQREECKRLAARWFERGAEAALGLSANDTAAELLERALELVAADAVAWRARLLIALGKLTASTSDMDSGARLLEKALGLARDAGERVAIARAAAALSWVLDQQVQFMAAARMADETLREIGDRDDLATALLLVRRAIAVSNGTDAVDQPHDDAQRALALARAGGDARLELEALDLLASLGDRDLAPWEELERRARAAGAWGKAVEAAQSQALRLIPDRAAEARPHLDRAVELGTARGLSEGLTWSHYAEVELGLVSGDWDGAVAAAGRALELGVRNGYDRAVLRTWSTVLPLAAARGDDALVEEGYVWLTTRFREPENPSPYARIMLAARQLEIARRGLREHFVPGVEERLASFELRYGLPSWLAALETVVDAWLAARELDGAARALERMAVSAASPDASMLGRAAYSLLHARLLAARGDDPRPDAEQALAGFRQSRAPWWCAKALRLLSTPAAEAEAAAIERSLGIAP